MFIKNEGHCELLINLDFTFNSISKGVNDPMMNDITIKGKTYRVSTLKGVVSKVHKRTYSDVHGGGGNEKKTNPIHTTINHITEVWVKLGDGKQKALKFDHDVSIVEGQNSSFLILHNGTDEAIVAIINHDFDSFEITSVKSISFLHPPVGRCYGVSFLILTFIFFALSMLIPNKDGFFLLLFILVVVALFVAIIPTMIYYNHELSIIDTEYNNAISEIANKTLTAI